MSIFSKLSSIKRHMVSFVYMLIVTSWALLKAGDNITSFSNSELPRLTAIAQRVHQPIHCAFEELTRAKAILDEMTEDHPALQGVYYKMQKASSHFIDLINANPEMLAAHPHYEVLYQLACRFCAEQVEVPCVKEEEK